MYKIDEVFVIVSSQLASVFLVLLVCCFLLMFVFLLFFFSLLFHVCFAAVLIYGK